MTIRRDQSGTRVLVIADAAGSGPHYHAGDEAMAQVALERLKKIVGAENLRLLCPFPRTAGPAYGVKAVRLPFHTTRTWILRLLVLPVYYWVLAARLLWHLGHAQVVFKAGGGNLKGRYDTFPILSLAARLNKHLFLVSQTIGPLTGSHQAGLRRALSGADWIGVRDRTYSERQLGLPVHFAVDDAVFLVPRHNEVTSELIREKSPLIGVSFRDCPPGQMDQLRQLIHATEEVALLLGARPVFIPHYIKRGGRDLAVAGLFEQECARANPVILRQVQPAQAVRALTGELALVLASRYHAVVFALAAGVPVVGVYRDEYTEAKLRGAFEQFDLEPHLIHLQEAAKDLLPMVRKVLANRQLFMDRAGLIREKEMETNIAPYLRLGSLVGEDQPWEAAVGPE